MDTPEKNIVLSISLLASGREETRKCLDSLRVIMDAVPSELIIVDTGCNEEQRAILEEYTDHIIPFTWCQDFSKARNTGLVEATGEWFLYIDDDEWFADSQEIIDFFQSGKYKQYGYATYIQRNFLDKAGKLYSDAYVSRMIQLREDTRFKSKIHEYLSPLYGSRISLNSVVHHYGYVYESEEEEQKHFERNKVLLDEMIQEEPDNMRWWVQLVQEYRSAHKDPEMLELAQKGLNKFKKAKKFLECVDLGTFYVGIVMAHMNMRQYEEVRKECIRGFADKRNTELCMAALFLYLAEADFYLEKWDEAELYALKYLRWYKKLLKREDMLVMQKTALLISETTDDIHLKKAYSLLICIQLKQKKVENLEKYFDKLEWNESSIYMFPPTIPCLAEGMALIPYEKVFTRVINVISSHKGLWQKLYDEIKYWDKKNKEGIENLLPVVSTMKKNIEYKWYALVCDKAARQAEELPEAVHQYFAHADNIFHVPERMRGIAKENGSIFEDAYLRVPMNRWKEQIRDIIAETDRDAFQEIEDFLRSLKTKDDVHYRYFAMRAAEANLLYEREWDCASCEDALRNFADMTMEFNRHYYRPEIFTVCRSLLPPSVRAAYWIQAGFEKEDYADCVACLANAVDNYKGLSDIVKTYIRLYKEEEYAKEQQAKDAAKELRKLIREVKAKVKQLMADRMFDEAAEVLGQLKAMCPDDLEVVSLNLRIHLNQLGVMA